MFPEFCSEAWLGGEFFFLSAVFLSWLSPSENIFDQDSSLLTAVFSEKEVSPIFEIWQYWYQNFQ